MIAMSGIGRGGTRVRGGEFGVSLRRGDESAVAANFDDRVDLPPIKTPTTVALRDKNRDICVYIIYISPINAKA